MLGNQMKEVSMLPIVPFLSQMNAAEEQKWQVALQKQLPEYSVRLYSELENNNPITEKITVAIVANPTAEQLVLFPALIWLQSLWAGIDGLLKILNDRPIKVVKLVDPNLASSMAHSVVAGCYYLQQNWWQYRQQQNQLLWEPLECRPAEETRVGIMGLGQLGSASAKKLTEAGFKVSGWRKTSSSNIAVNNKPLIDDIPVFAGEQSLPSFMKELDILLCLLPLTRQTKQLLNKQTLSLLPTGASIINFARGAIINHDDLLELLTTQHLSHAILDVFVHEPLPSTDPLWKHPAVTILPHVSAQTNLSSATKIAASNISQYYESNVLPKFVDPTSGY